MPAHPSPAQDRPARVALVCGATGAVGQAICRGLADRGHPVAVHCRTDVAAADLLVKELGALVPATTVTGDLVSPEQADAVVRSVADQLGARPAVVVNAAYPRAGSCYLADTDASEVEKHLDGFRMHANLCRSAIPGMRAAGWGRIVLIAGALAGRFFPGLSLMSGVKAGMTSFSRAVALEEGPHGITVNVVSPGRLEFDDGGGAFDPDPAYELLDEVTRLRVALPTVPTPADVATMVGFLASEEAAAVTGQIVYVAGGEVI